ncbi:MAG: quinone-dependent dihydroorotate dehydrogenase [Candidatus Limnocylindria bacterium]
MSWRTAAYCAVRPALFRIDAERAHHAALATLRIAGDHSLGRALLAATGGAGRSGSGGRNGGAGARLLGLEFRNRLGVGAGFDKDGVALRGWAALGLGFAEVGTVTRLPQPGNPRPRVFRLIADDALINRMGFNNAGAAALAERLHLVRDRLPRGFVVGVNIGRGRDTRDEATVDDYLAAYRAVAPVADYVTINVSSPNTPGIRDLQEPPRLVALVEQLCAQPIVRPLVVKLSPDLSATGFDSTVTALADTPAEGLILSNTTTARHALRSPARTEIGGLSGRPLRSGVVSALRRARELTGDRFAVIASGGIFGAEDARHAVLAGASLVQVWTSLVYRGPGLVGEIAAAVSGS